MAEFVQVDLVERERDEQVVILGLGHAERAYFGEELYVALLRVEVDEHGYVELGAFFVRRRLVAFV